MCQRKMILYNKEEIRVQMHTYIQLILPISIKQPHWLGFNGGNNFPLLVFTKQILKFKQNLNTLNLFWF